MSDMVGDLHWMAAKAVEDRTPERESIPRVAVRDRGAGRPTKRERREIDRFRDHSSGEDDWLTELLRERD